MTNIVEPNVGLLRVKEGGSAIRRTLKPIVEDGSPFRPVYDILRYTLTAILVVATVWAIGAILAAATMRKVLSMLNEEVKHLPAGAAPVKTLVASVAAVGLATGGLAGGLYSDVKSDPAGQSARAPASPARNPKDAGLDPSVSDMLATLSGRVDDITKSLPEISRAVDVAADRTAQVGRQAYLISGSVGKLASDTDLVKTSVGAMKTQIDNRLPGIDANASGTFDRVGTIGQQVVGIARDTGQIKTDTKYASSGVGRIETLALPGLSKQVAGVSGSVATLQSSLGTTQAFLMNEILQSSSRSGGRSISTRLANLFRPQRYVVTDPVCSSFSQRMIFDPVDGKLAQNLCQAKGVTMSRKTFLQQLCGRQCDEQTSQLLGLWKDQIFRDTRRYHKESGFEALRY